jgi:hypothetical protein
LWVSGRTRAAGPQNRRHQHQRTHEFT